MAHATVDIGVAVTGGSVKGGFPMRSTLRLLGLAFGALSVIMLLKHGFDFGFVAPFELMLGFYDRLLRFLFGWLEPWAIAMLGLLQDWWPWPLHLFPHWKYVFVLMSLYFLRSAVDAFSIGAAVSAAVRGAWGVFVALVASIAAGTVPATSADATANFLIAAIPIIGVSVSDLGWNAWWAAWLRRPRLTWWQDFKRTEVYTLRRDAIGVLIAFVGVQLPIVQRLPNPGLGILAFLIVALALSYVVLGVVDANFNRAKGDTWLQGFRKDGGARLGLAMLAVLAGAGVFVAINAGLVLLGF